jgi:predicted RND superfamily exporter protein
VLRNALAKFQSVILAHPGKVLIFSGLLLVVAAFLIQGVEFRSSRSELASKDDPEQQRFDHFIEETGSDNLLFACVKAREGTTASTENLRAFADDLARELRNDPIVARVFHRVPLDWIVERGLYLADPALLDSAVESFDAQEALVETLASVKGLADLNDALADRMSAGLAGETSIPEDAAERLGILLSLLEAERRLLDSPETFVAEIENRSTLEILAGDNPQLASGGYLTTRDNDILFLLVSPSGRDDTLNFLRKFVGTVRERAANVAREHEGIVVALTGQPAMAVEEMNSIRRDTWFTSAVAIIGVTLLTLLVFRWRSHVWIVLGALALGVIWAFGAVRLELGYLNMITSSAISTLIGVGVAYGIHPVSEYELEGAHTVDPLTAVRESFSRTGPPVTVAAITTSAAFFSILLMKFPGFAELGLVAGFGVLLCLAAALITLPALLLVYGRWRHRHRRPGGASTAVDRFWVEKGAALVCRFPRTISIGALVVTAFLGWMATGISFNRNLLDLLPSKSEAVAHQRIMVDETDMSPVAGMVLADSLDELRELKRRSDAEPVIKRFDSILRFLPEDPEHSTSAVAGIRRVLDTVAIPDRFDPIDRETLEASLWRLEETFGIATEDAFGAGQGDLAGVLDEARATVEASATIVAEADEAAAQSWSLAQEKLRTWSVGLFEELRRAARSEPPTVQDLPQEIQERLVTDTGRYLAIFEPRGSVFDPDILDEYVLAARRISPNSTGFPLVFSEHSRQITDGFYLSVAVGLSLVLLILILDYRNLRDACLASLPLALGVVWMMGLMRLLGLSFNFANLVAVPLIIGVGIDNGVHVIHRVRLEGVDGMGVVLRHTARAILIASLTTMIGFGSLALASHRGLASLGTVLLLGVGSCLVTSVIVLPNMLVALGLTRR